MSRFHLIYSLNEVDVRDEIHEIVDVDFSPLYDHNEDLDIEDYEMESKINEIYEMKLFQLLNESAKGLKGGRGRRLAASLPCVGPLGRWVRCNLPEEQCQARMPAL